MAVGVVEVEAAPAVPAVGFAVGLIVRIAAIFHARFLDTREDRFEFLVADMKCVMVALKRCAVVEIER